MTILFTTIGYQLVALVYAIFAGVILSRGARSRISYIFLAAIAATAVWAQFFVLDNYDLIRGWAVDLSGLARDSAWIIFSLALIYPKSGQRGYWNSVAAIAGALIVAQLIFFWSGPTLGVVAGVLIDAALIRVIATLFSVVLVENALSAASRANFWALKHWAIGLLATLAIQLIVRIPEFLTHTSNPDVALAYPLVALIALPFFAISSARLPQLQLRIRSSRTFVLHSATLVGVGILLQGTAVAAWYVRSYGGTNGTALAITIAFSGIVGIAAALVSGTVRSRLRLLINEHLFSLRYDYRLEWERAIRNLTASTDKSLAERALQILCDLLDTSGGAIWLHRESWRQFKLSGKFGVSVHAPALPEDDERIVLLRQDDRPFVQVATKDGGDVRFANFQPLMDDGWLVLPLRYRSTLAGFIVLNKPRVSRKLDWEDEGLVRVLAMQIAAYLVQEETAQSLADARQLEDFNKRFAFVVHDIKNTIGQLSLLVRNIARFGDQKEFRDDMVITLGNSVERLEILLKSLTAVGTKAPGQGGVAHLFDLTELFDKFVHKKKALGLNLELRNLAGFLAIRTDSVALSRVVEHVVSNAFEASEQGATVVIDLSLTKTMLEIAVIDRGAGMTQQFIDEELFRPLRSTKQDGFGVGGYQIRELMRDLGGDVNVSSVLGNGTRVVLSLPRTLVLADP